MMLRTNCAVIMVGLVLASALPVSAQQMPDPSEIHGRAIPAPELGNGTVTVRVVREAIGNNIAGQQVRVTVDGTSKTATTDDQGRAEFSGLPLNGQARAEATVEGESLVSEPFSVPASGGLRVILVAGMARAAERRKQEEAAAAQAPPSKGIVVFGGDSRVLMQFQDDALQVFYILEIVNTARTRVDIGGPLLIDLPTGSGGASVLEGSSPTATVSGNRLTVTGPFAAGTTQVQLGYTLRYSGTQLKFEQKFPAALEQITVGVQKLGDLSMSSPQFQQTSELPTENGMVFLVANGPGLPQGGVLTMDLVNLPARSRAPRYIALGLVVGIIILGAWLSISAPTYDSRKTLVRRRDTLLKELEQLELKRRSGEISLERYTTRRQRVVTELEQIYGQLDDAGLGPRGGDEGVAA